MAKKLLLPLVILAALSFFLAYYWWGYKSPSIGIDDANIYFVYMKNLAAGHGFVWNVGGERVEGFTSLLWTLTGSLFAKISPAHYPTLLLALGAILTFFTVYPVLLFSRKINKTEHRGITSVDLLILALLLLPRGFIEWNILCLMETSLWSFLLVNISLQLCGYYLYGKQIKTIRFCILIILINLTRPESLLYNFLFVGILMMMLQADYGWKRAIRKVMVPLFAHLLSFASLVIWRISYFGFPFPNTYYAKVSASKKDNIIGGMKYLFNFFNFYPQTIAITVLLAFFSWLILKKWRIPTQLSAEEKILCILITIIFCGLAVPLATGGDHFMYSRFYQPLLPLMYMAVTFTGLWTNTFGITLEGKNFTKTAVTVSILSLVLVVAKANIFDFTKSIYTNFGEFQLAKDGREAADKFNDCFSDLPTYPTIGTLASGGAGYQYKGKTIDLMGLNNTLMAHANPIKTGFRNHASFDKGAFWKLRPDIMGTGFGGDIIKDPSTFVLYENQKNYRTTDFMYICYKQIFDDKDFREAYTPALVREKNHSYYIFAYYAKSFLQTLDGMHYQVNILHRTFNPDQPATPSTNTN